ncbi:MAG: methyl-accepting chemotaxis protein, partial [Shewanella sp.]
MKQMQFRTIDGILIKFSLNGKFWLICGLVASITAVIAITNYQHSLRTLEFAAISRVQASVDAFAQIASAQQLEGESLTQFAQQHGMTLIPREVQGQYQGDNVIASKYVADGQALQLSQPVAAWVNDARSSASVMFWLALIGLLPLFQLCYWISTSLGSGLWDIYAAIKRLADGDLSVRLNFFGSDDFSMMAREIDRNAENMSEMVSAIRGNAQTLTQAAAEFNQQAAT